MRIGGEYVEKLFFAKSMPMVVALFIKMASYRGFIYLNVHSF